MDTISNEAINGLNASIQSLLPNLGAGGPQLVLTITPLSISPTGLGGFVSINEQPLGEIFGRRIHALAQVSIVTDNADARRSAATQVLNAFFAADRATLLQVGILRIAIDPLSESSSGDNSSTGGDLKFTVFYEYLQIPQVAEGVIQEIPITLNLG
jgi:hypothetical protein